MAGVTKESGMIDKDAPTMVLERSLKRFAEVMGIETTETPTTNGDNMKTASVAQKIAAADEDSRGSQLMTGLDRGDYGTQAEYVARQKKETAQAAPDGTEEFGNQDQSVRYDDKSYSISGAGDARIATRAIDAIVQIARGAAQQPVTVKKTAAPDPAAANAAADSGPGASGKDIGAPAGGEPDAVKEGEEEAEAKAPPPKPEMALPAPGADGGMALTKIKEKIRDISQTLDVSKQVKDALEDVLSESGGDTLASKKDKPRVAAVKEAVERGDDGKDTPHFEMGNKRVLHSAWDGPDYFPTDGDPDWSSYDESKTKGAAAEKTQSHTGQPYADSSDRFYALASKTAAHLNHTVEFLNKKGVFASKDTKMQTLTDELLQEVTAKHDKFLKLMQRYAEEKAPTNHELVARAEKHAKVLASRKHIATLAQKFAGKKHTQEDATLLTNLAKRVASWTKEADSRSPNEMTTSQADEHNRYEKSLQGDTASDETDVGTDLKLESPETSSTIDKARGYLDKRHTQDVKGSTVAVKQSEYDRVVGDIKIIDAVHDGMGKSLNDLKKMTHAKAREAAVTTLESTIPRLKKASDTLQALVQKKVASKDVAEMRKQLADEVQKARVLTANAKQLLLMASAAALESNYQRSVFDRVSPAFKVAVSQVESGHMALSELPTKVSEYVRMSPGEFKVAANMVRDFLANGQRRGMSRTASRMPSVQSENVPYKIEDELSGLFDD